jgi:hypothetical protein
MTRTRLIDCTLQHKVGSQSYNEERGLGWVPIVDVLREESRRVRPPWSNQNTMF